MKIGFLSDSHMKHLRLEADKQLSECDVVIHAGDISTVGYKHEVTQFCKWYKSIKCDMKIFISGNHDWLFQENPEEAKEIVENYNLCYLQDSSVEFEDVLIYGSPWQPEFYNWAFNLPRGGVDLEEKWNLIPQNTDILVTHGPPQGILDVSGSPYNTPMLGCEILRDRVEKIKPKIHVFGHIHGSRGYYFNGETHFINACVLNERYEVAGLPFIVEWEKESNSINFLNA